MAIHKASPRKTKHIATIKKSQKRMPTRKELSRIGVNSRGEDINLKRKVLPAAKKSTVKASNVRVKKVKKKQTIIGRLQTFDANRRMKLAHGQAGIAGPKGVGSNAAKLAVGKRAAKGMQAAIIKKNLAKHK